MQHLFTVRTVVAACNFDDSIHIGDLNAHAAAHGSIDSWLVLFSSSDPTIPAHTAQSSTQLAIAPMLYVVTALLLLKSGRAAGH